MRNETVAEGIKRRMGKKAAEGRQRMNTAVQLAIWSGVIAVAVTVTAVASSTWGH